MRTIIYFNRDWDFYKKEGDMPEHVDLPHTWNAVDGQDGGNDYYRGTCTYKKEFQTPKTGKEDCVILEFQGVAMTANVWLNDVLLAHHEGGYSTFRVDLTEYLAAEGEQNTLVVTADNGANDRVYPQMADFTFYGGIYRDVSLIILSKEHFELEKDGSDGVKITPQVLLDERKAVVQIESWHNSDAAVRYTILSPEGTGTQFWESWRKKQNQSESDTIRFPAIDSTEVVDVDGKAEAVIEISDVRLWDGLNDPYLYLLKAELIGNNQEVLDTIYKRFGCRTISFDTEKGFMLNGSEYPLRGVSRHQDRAGVGNALTNEMHQEDMKLIHEIGANTIRLAHYQQAQYFYDLCDEYGMVVWAEIPYITKHMEQGRENTLSQMRELVVQNYNHVSIVCWGLSNEITAASPVNDDLLENHKQLNELCHSLDPTRPTTIAHVFMLETDSPMITVSDIGSYNLYYGWYLGELEENESFFDTYHEKYPDRVIGFSEYGADANPQYQTDCPERSDYTETYQCVYHEHILSVIEKRPYLWATHVWNMFDFAADGRDEGGRHGVNQKGLVTIDRTIKKDAFYLYKAYWSRDEFVHICGRRYVERTENSTHIKVYTNLSEISLYVDGKLFEKKNGNKIFEFDVPISGKHQIRAAAFSLLTDKYEDTVEIQKVKNKNPDYTMMIKQEVVNWFDQDEIDETCFSIKDKMGDIMQNPTGAAIIENIMNQARARRGDVAKGTEDNPVLKKMLAQMTVDKLLKQSGDAIATEKIKELNEALQRIKKEVIS